MNPEIKTFCWSCGKKLPFCTCGSEMVVMEVKRPTEILPTCGALSHKDVITEPWLDPDRKHEVLARPCCECGQYWECTQEDWINGTCPNCGAVGNELNKKITKNELTNKEKILKSLIKFEAKK